MVMAERRNWSNPLNASTSIIPFAAIAQGRARFGIDPAMILALALTVALSAWLLLGGHAALFGTDPLAMTST